VNEWGGEVAGMRSVSVWGSGVLGGSTIFRFSFTGTERRAKKHGQGQKTKKHVIKKPAAKPVAQSKSSKSEDATIKSAATRMSAVDSMTDESDGDDNPKVQPEPQGMKAPMCIEMFAGCKELTKSLTKLGLTTKAFEIEDGDEFNILNKATFAQLRNWLMSGTRYIHFGPPCKTFSMARWPKVRTHHDKQAFV
jgi:hypothetical protein